jgi:hypothetical protein
VLAAPVLQARLLPEPVVPRAAQPVPRLAAVVAARAEQAASRNSDAVRYAAKPDVRRDALAECS